MEDWKGPDVDKNLCSGCLQRASANENFKCCSKCKQAYYCSKECQVGHWKTHKVNCKRQVAAKDLASQLHQKRELRLFQEWKRQVKNGGILGYMLTSFFGWNQLCHLEQDKRFIMLTLVFDYNKRNFIPESEPSICRIDAAGQQHAQDLRQAYASFPPLAEDACNILAWIMVEGMNIASVMPLVMSRPLEGTVTRASWRELQELLIGVTLKSSKFATWPALMQQNLNSSINSYVRRSSYFQPFFVNALHIESASSLHKTHIVVVDMELGHGLGEIKRLESYSVKPVNEVVSHMQEAGILTSEARQLMDLENNPQLVQSRKQYPNNCYLPILFHCRTKAAFVCPNLIEVSPNHAIYPVKQCDKKAKAAFQNLQKVRFPSVQSPALH